MASIHDVNQQKLTEELARELEGKLKAPEWHNFVKTGIHKERPPTQENWWSIRAASVLKQIYKNGPVGVSKLRTKYGGRQNRGTKPGRMAKASGNIIRKILQQLEEAKLIKKSEGDRKGRVITASGQALLDKTAVKIMKASKVAK